MYARTYIIYTLLLKIYLPLSRYIDVSRLCRYLVWLSRLHRCRGFGVQSPSDYSFVRYVVNEHWPYYAYEDMRSKYPTASWLERKMGELLLRVANFRQPSSTINLVAPIDFYDDYLKAGCKRQAIHHSLEACEDLDLVFMPCDSLNIQSAMEKADDSSIVVVNGIHKDRKSWSCWKAMKNDNRVTVSFDLYYCGILMFDKKRYKTHYTINF